MKKEIKEDGGLLTNKQLAAKLHCTTVHVLAMQKEGMPCVFLGKATCGRGSRPRYDWEQVKAWLEQRTAATRKELAK